MAWKDQKDKPHAPGVGEKDKPSEKQLLSITFDSVKAQSIRKACQLQKQAPNKVCEAESDGGATIAGD